MRTRQSVCIKKVRSPAEEDALLAAQRSELALFPYRCARCRQFHLTSRSKGKRLARPRAEPYNP
jgi:hypothetical protein